MKTNNTDFIKDNKIFIWIAAITGSILLLPYLAMTFGWNVPAIGYEESNKVDWSSFDFIMMGALIFGTGFMFVQVARVIPRKYRLLTACIFALGFLYVWAELAVGIFTNIGS